jgi:hypothetical protein
VRGPSAITPEHFSEWPSRAHEATKQTRRFFPAPDFRSPIHRPPAARVGLSLNSTARVRPLESAVATQPQLQPALLRLSVIIPYYFTRCTLLYAPRPATLTCGSSSRRCARYARESRSFETVAAVFDRRSNLVREWSNRHSPAIVVDPIVN